jgi:hypothetical protein
VLTILGKIGATHAAMRVRAALAAHPAPAPDCTCRCHGWEVIECPHCNGAAPAGPAVGRL